MFEIEEQAEAITFQHNGRRLRVAFTANEIARITYTEHRNFVDRPSRIVVPASEHTTFDLHEDAEKWVIASSDLLAHISKETGALSFFTPTGKLLFREPERGGKRLTRKNVTRNVFDNSAAIQMQSIDGARSSATNYETIVDRQAFEAKLEFVFSEEEALFGLGSHEEGYGNLRGRSRELYQQNMKAVVPHLVSTRGYGVLMDCCSLMTFHDDALGSYWWADVVEELDYYVIAGDNFDEVMRGYRKLTGMTPLPPKWAFGYVQSKERYVTADEILHVVEEYRRRDVPLDCIVLDWKSWPNGSGWGQKSFDPIRFPDAPGFISKLHELGARLMVSIWPIMTGGCENQRELIEKGLMLGNQATYDAFRPEARACYWEQARRGLFSNGVDAWWCDCTEPFEADWLGAVKPEPHLRLAINTQESKLYLDAGEINAYSLLHSQGIYEGQRRVESAKRVLNLTRSSYAGQHRYGTFTWNGDVCATWEALRRCIPEGVNFCATGEAYWTVDAGGFFVDNKPGLWFWRGEYPDGCRGLTAMDAHEPDSKDSGSTDKGFWELYTRWLQYAAFLPMMRSHGTDVAREIWRFGDAGSIFYDAIAACIRLRYRLIPYLYSMAAAITFDGKAMVRALALEFPEDAQTHDIMDEYMFGRSLLVCPVVRPMYFGPGSQPLAGEPKTRPVYLPKGTRWFDFWNGAIYEGGQTIVASSPIDRIPLFARAGSVLPMTEVMRYSDEVRDAPYEIRVYTGADAQFDLYEDAGDGYGYEREEHVFIRMRWHQRQAELVIEKQEGSFAGMIEARDYRIVFMVPGGRYERVLHYTGEEVWVQLGEKES